MDMPDTTTTPRPSKEDESRWKKLWKKVSNRRQKEQPLRLEIVCDDVSTLTNDNASAGSELSSHCKDAKPVEHLLSNSNTEGGKVSQTEALESIEERVVKSNSGETPPTHSETQASSLFEHVDMTLGNLVVESLTGREGSSISWSQQMRVDTSILPLFTVKRSSTNNCRQQEDLIDEICVNGDFEENVPESTTFDSSFAPEKDQSSSAWAKPFQRLRQVAQKEQNKSVAGEICANTLVVKEKAFSGQGLSTKEKSAAGVGPVDTCKKGVERKRSKELDFALNKAFDALELGTDVTFKSSDRTVKSLAKSVASTSVTQESSAASILSALSCCTPCLPPTHHTVSISETHDESFEEMTYATTFDDSLSRSHGSLTAYVPEERFSKGSSSHRRSTSRTQSKHPPSPKKTKQTVTAKEPKNRRRAQKVR